MTDTKYAPNLVFPDHARDCYMNTASTCRPTCTCREDARLVEEVDTLRGILEERETDLMNVQRRYAGQQTLPYPRYEELRKRCKNQQSRIAELNEQNAAQAEQLAAKDAEIAELRASKTELADHADHYRGEWLTAKARAEAAEAALAKSQQEHQQDRRCMAEEIKRLQAVKTAAEALGRESSTSNPFFFADRMQERWNDLHAALKEAGHD